ncbi:MAG: sugar-binding domain-containing protein [Bacteroidota bacterium]
MKNFILCLFYVTNLSFCVLKAQDIPLPEHPRPDFERTDWVNLNGSWIFGFDSLDTGIKDQWFSNSKHFPLTIKVPFPWGSPLSGVPDKADIGWYQKNITVKPDWKDKRIFITVGASDWESSIWIDNQLVGTHQGGYTPFSFELTKYIQPGKEHSITIRVDDKRRLFTLYGKQGYVNSSGIWQTI